MCFCQMCFSPFGEEEKLFCCLTQSQKAEELNPDKKEHLFCDTVSFFFLYKSFAISTFFFFLVLSLTCLPSVISFQFQYNIKCRAFVNKYVDRHVSLLLIASWLLHYFYALEMFLRGKHESKVFFYPPRTRFHKCVGKTNWWQILFSVWGQMSLMVLENILYSYQSLWDSNAVRTSNKPTQKIESNLNLKRWREETPRTLNYKHNSQVTCPQHRI